MTETFYDWLPEGGRRCRVCKAEHPRHEGGCALLGLRVRVQELAQQLGLHVATMRELLDDVDALLRGDRPGGG